MHYILWIGVRNFYVNALTDLTQEGKSVVVHHRKAVLDMTPNAEARGVYVGMSLAEAKAILGPEAHYVAWEAEPYRAAQARWLDVCTEFTGVIEPEYQHSAYLDLSAHPDPRQVVAELRTALEVSGFRCLLGGAGCRWVAKLCGLKGDEDEMGWRMPQAFVAPMSLDRLPLTTELKTRLSLLGYRRIGELIEVPLETFQSQFGAEAYEILRAAHGRGETYVRALYPLERLSTRYVFDGAPEVREAVDLGLRTLARQLGHSLQERDQVGKELCLMFEREDESPLERSRIFTKPLADETSIWVALNLLTADWPAERVAALHVSLPNLSASSRKQQPLSETPYEQREGVVAQALSRVKQVFGDSVVRAGVAEIPRIAFLRAFKDGFGWR